MHGLSAGVFLSVLAYYPFIYMPVAAVLRRLDPTLEDVAASLGTPPWRVFFRVVLPQLKLAICGGALLVALHLLAEYGLYVMIRFDTFTTAIYDQFQSTFSGPAANMLAGVLLALCCLAILCWKA
jgi:iron(III) transport system permease protein